jgi:hypothetical protein
MTTDMEKWEAKAKDFYEKDECPKKLECLIGSGNFKHDFLSQGARKECIGMSDEVKPDTKCFYEEILKEGETESKHSLVRINKKTY